MLRKERCSPQVNMREAHLRDFLAVAELGSVRGAARKLRLSQGAVSKNLVALERELGVALLLRSAHGVEPTEYGQILLRRARLADGELRKAREEIAHRAGHAHGIVQVGLSSTAEALLAAEAIQRYREQHPDSLVHVRGGTASTLVALLREGQIDFAVTPVATPVVGPDLHAERLFSADFVVVAREGHPLAAATEIGQLADCEWIHGARPGELDPMIVAAFRKAGLPAPRFAVQRDSFSALLFLLLQSDYLALATEPTVTPFCGKGMLVRLPLASRPGVSIQSLLTSATRPLTPRALALATHIRKLARQLRR
jgi:LysR family transcriptional regulator, regulator of abg operon